MRILITGASGFIGSHVTQALIQAGHAVTVCVRSPAAARRRWPGVNAIAADYVKDRHVADWLPRLEGIDVVINAVGIIREKGAQTFEALHTATPYALFKACEQAGVGKVVQISALGADETAFSRYHLSKRAADECLQGLHVSWVILMPSIVYGPGAKSMAFFRAIASLPWIPLVEKGDQRVQPIHIGDLVKALMHVIRPERRGGLKVALVGPGAIALKEIYTQLRRWLGLGTARFVSVPYRLTLLGARLGSVLGDSPLTSESVRMLRKGNVADVAPFVEQFGFEPMSFEQALAATPAQQADRWHAGLFFLRPLLRLSIAFVWIFTGIVSAFVFPVEQSYALLARVGIEGIWAPVMLYGAALTDFALGVATLAAWRLHWIAAIQIAVMALYTLIITFTQPEQWIHPFGPISKNVPLIVATLAMVVLERK